MSEQRERVLKSTVETYLQAKARKLDETISEREARDPRSHGMQRHYSVASIHRRAHELNGSLRLAFYLGWVTMGDDIEAEVKRVLFRAEQVTRPSTRKHYPRSRRVKS